MEVFIAGLESKVGNCAWQILHTELAKPLLLRSQHRHITSSQNRNKLSQSCFSELGEKVTNQEKTDQNVQVLFLKKRQIECEDEDEEKPSAPGDDLCPPRDPSHPHPSPSCSPAAIEGIKCRNALIGPVKSCRREETGCQKLPSSSLEILPPETAENPGGGQNNGNTPTLKHSLNVKKKNTHNFLHI